jgi:hypothetical protein
VFRLRVRATYERLKTRRLLFFRALLLLAAFIPIGIGASWFLTLRCVSSEQRIINDIKYWCTPLETDYYQMQNMTADINVTFQGVEFLFPRQTITPAGPRIQVLTRFSDGTKETLAQTIIGPDHASILLLTEHVNPRAGIMFDSRTGEILLLVEMK